MMNNLMPVRGCMVSIKNQENGMVISPVSDSQIPSAVVKTFSGKTLRVPLADLSGAFESGHRVITSIKRGRAQLGRVTGTRTLAGAHLIMVQNESSGSIGSFPFESLAWAPDSRWRYERALQERKNSGERFALQAMALGLKFWNDATGALDRLDVDPLPHQIQLVHHILKSGDLNWLIGDDVGLGKTIELGLLLTALGRKKKADRVLIVVPSGLTRNWQEEMRVKFGLDFLIYGLDFKINHEWQWHERTHVIAGMDTIKPTSSDDDGTDFTTHFGKLMKSRLWDVIAIDEAHRISRSAKGNVTLRHRLALELRTMSESLFLLTATPHSGDDGRFQSLLELARPDLQDEIDRISGEDYSVVPRVVYRNRKIDVTDIDGNFIFKGEKVHLVDVGKNEAVEAVESALGAYLSNGYSLKADNTRAMAIGFVMTAYRKLASSSLVALRAALTRRVDKITHAKELAELALEDMERLGEDASPEQMALFDSDESFFENEIELARRVIDLCDEAIFEDPKIAKLVSLVDDVVIRQGKKILIFTEYRATQTHVQAALQKLIGVSLPILHGGMTSDEKNNAIARFEQESPVLISTEAGGEGFNMHRACHVLANYDLPWNPTRLLQRRGRIYRYGQQEIVFVFNLMSRDTMDNQIMAMTVEKAEKIARSLALVDSGYGENFVGEILGELLEHLDLSSVFDNAMTDGKSRTEQRIHEALERARNSRAIQDEILAHAGGFDPEALRKMDNYGPQHLFTFVSRMCAIKGIVVHEVSAGTVRLEMGLDHRGVYSDFGMKTKPYVTMDRAVYRRRPGTVLLDFNSDFVRQLIEEASSHEFGSSYGVVREGIDASEDIGLMIAKWQDSRGRVMDEELMAVGMETGKIDPRFVTRLFDNTIPENAPSHLAKIEREKNVASLIRNADTQMRSKSEGKIPNDLLLVGIGEAV